MLDPDFPPGCPLKRRTRSVLSELNQQSVRPFQLVRPPGHTSTFGNMGRAQVLCLEVGVLGFLFCLVLFLFLANLVAKYRQEEPLVNYI